MFCFDVSFFISIISFFISFISFDNTQKTIYRTAKKTSFHSPSLAVSVEAGDVSFFDSCNVCNDLLCF